MIPKDAKIIWLRPGTKVPDFSRSPHGQHSGEPWVPLGTEEWPSEVPLSSNYGIVLDNTFLLVDFDHDHADREKLESSLTETWSQRTGRQSAVGKHYLFRVPQGWKGVGKRVLVGRDGKPIADVKGNGYLVGPGSVVDGHPYRLTNGAEPLDAPQWLLDFAQDTPRAKLQSSGGVNGVPNGDHDAFLMREAARMRGQLGLSEAAIQRYLAKGPLAILEEVDEANPYTIDDVKRIAHSVSKYEASDNTVTSTLAPSGWTSAADRETSLPLMDWILYNFIPRNEVTLVYGDGGIGKSTFASYIAAKALKQGLSVGFAGVEEPFERFVVRVSLTDPELTMEHYAKLIDIGNAWRFPENGPDLRAALHEFPLDVLYFDSIYSHFGAVEGNEGIRARTCLTPLASIAQELKVAVIGTFHENKAGSLMGSVEMKNVSRMLLHATRPRGKPFRLSVFKTNFTYPDYDLQFNATARPAFSLQGEPWKERNEEGDIVDVTLHVMTDHIRVNESQSEDTEIDSSEESQYADKFREQAIAVLQEFPDIGRQKLMNILGCGERKARNLLSLLRPNTEENNDLL